MTTNATSTKSQLTPEQIALQKAKDAEEEKIECAEIDIVTPQNQRYQKTAVWSDYVFFDIPANGFFVKVQSRNTKTGEEKVIFCKKAEYQDVYDLQVINNTIFISI